MHVLWNISATMPSLRTHVLFQQSNASFRIRLHAQESSSETRSIPHHFTIQYIQQPYYSITMRYTSTKLSPYPYTLLSYGNKPIVMYGVATVRCTYNDTTF